MDDMEEDVGMSSKQTSDVDLKIYQPSEKKQSAKSRAKSYVSFKDQKRRKSNNRNSISGIDGADEMLVDKSVRESVLNLREMVIQKSRKKTASTNQLRGRLDIKESRAVNARNVQHIRIGSGALISPPLQSVSDRENEDR